MDATTAALVGATGGAGTTRLAVETATLLADGGAEVVVLDAAYATQGLGDYLDGALDPDVTALVTDAADEPLSAGLVDLDADVAGRVACCPAAAPFERVARAKTADAAQRFAERVAAAAESFDAVVVDVPPVATNQAVAAVDAADAVALVAPGTTRGADAVGRGRARLADVGAAADAVVATRGDLSVADATVPETAAPVTRAPTIRTDGEFAAGIASVAETLFGAETAVSTDDGLLAGARDRL
jgi:MinD-like ATPase involved in chromosome partitioning or flagellar assembly